jgi:hypothetical protein
MRLGRVSQDTEHGVNGKKYARIARFLIPESKSQEGS